MDKVLVIGQGGREHALAWKLASSPHIEKVFVAPGNPAMEWDHKIKCENISYDNPDLIVQFCKQNQIALVVVGPDNALANGLVDDLLEHSILVFGPTKMAAQLESSKAFAKNLMIANGIPTARAQIFTDIEMVKSFLDKNLYLSGYVVKASGLALGKGVFVCDNKEQAYQAASQLLGGLCGQSGNTIVIEEKLIGPEVSVFVLADGGPDFVYLGSACDYKTLNDNDQGPNTGGMGAFTVTPQQESLFLDDVLAQVVKPTLKAMKNQNTSFSGVLFIGCMITPQGPKVLEYNVRFGDPETQAILGLIEDDFYLLLKAAAKKELSSYPPVTKKSGVILHVVKVSEGYPGLGDQSIKLGVALDCFNQSGTISSCHDIAQSGVSPQVRDQSKDNREVFLNLIKNHPFNSFGDYKYFFSGIKIKKVEILSKNSDAISEPKLVTVSESQLVTSGGRVLGVSVYHQDIQSARLVAYEKLKLIKFQGEHFRKDIGWYRL